MIVTDKMIDDALGASIPDFTPKEAGGWLHFGEKTKRTLVKAMLEAALTPPKALTVNTSTPGNDLEYNGLAATRDLERRVQKLEWIVSTLMEGKGIE